ncbi:MAG: lysylphosphatidylglycerol synthase transmembrane domain-containing protein [Moraxellaceae bacterium]
MLHHGKNKRNLLSGLFTAQRRILLTAVIILSIGAPLLIGGQTTLHLLASLSQTSLIILLLLLVMKWGLNTLRCQLLFRANGIRFRNTETLAMIWLYDAASESTPGGLGGPIAGWALLRHRQIPTTTIAGLGLLILTADIIAIMTLILWALLVTTFMHQQSEHWQIMAVLIATMLALALLWILLRYRRELIRYVGRLRSTLGLGKQRSIGPVRLWLRMGQTVERMAQLPHLSLLIIVLASVGHWCCRLSILYLAILALGQHVAWTDTFIIQLCSGLTGMMVGLPGGFLGADLTMTALLLPLMDPKAIATVILLWRLMTFHITLLVGGLSFTWLAGRLLPSAGRQSTEN